MSLALFMFLYSEVFCTVGVALSFTIMKAAINNGAEIFQAVIYWY